MGAKAGEFVAKRHPAGAKSAKVTWFTSAIKGSDINLVETKYGDTGKEV